MNKIEDVLLHRDPFLFVNSIEIVNGDIQGSYCFPENYFVFNGHFPNNPIVPGVLLVECMIQCGGAGIKILQKEKASMFVLATIEKARFFELVKPGEDILVTIKNEVVDQKFINQQGKAFVQNKLVAKAQWLCVKRDTVINAK